MAKIVEVQALRFGAALAVARAHAIPGFETIGIYLAFAAMPAKEPALFQP